MDGFKTKTTVCQTRGWLLFVCVNSVLLLNTSSSTTPGERESERAPAPEPMGVTPTPTSIYGVVVRETGDRKRR